MIIRWISLLALVLAVYCSFRGLSSAAVISIDFGSEWIKVALVKPGVPMEIVLNKESKRKTAAVVSIRNNDRLFGDPALNVAVKYPKSAYRYLQLLVGQKFDSPMVQKYRNWFPFYDLRKDEERGTVVFQHDEDTAYSVPELIGMMLNNSRHTAEAYAGVPIRDVVITVPPFFSQAQRREMMHSASLVGLNVLQLMSDNAAAGLNYGLFRQASFNTTPHYIMFYDMGAASTTATIVEYRKVQVKEGTLANVHPQLTVKGTGFNLMLGGLEMDLRLQQHLAKLFQEQKKTKGSVYDSPRAMAKLLKEAKRVKQVLSANTDHYAQIEGLLEDVDFRAKITRSEFEELCSDLLEQVSDPVKQALESADMTMDEIDSVILVGGGTRVPKVQEILLKAVNKPELGKNLNTDEAIALGAVYQGAGHTKLFRVKKFIVKDGALFPIQVSFTRVTLSNSDEGDEEVTKIIKRTLFQRSNPFPAKKVLTFNRHTTDFSFKVFYGDLDFLPAEEKSYLGRVNISEVYLAGVGDALSQHPQGEAKGIKAHFNMDDSGILNLTFVESVFEYPEDTEEQSTLSKIGSKLSSFFGMGGEDSEAKETPSDGEEIPADGNETETSTGAAREANAAGDSATDGAADQTDGMKDDSSETPEVQDDTADTDDDRTKATDDEVEVEQEPETVSEELEPEVDDSVPDEVPSEEEVEEPVPAEEADSEGEGSEKETSEEGEGVEGKASEESEGEKREGEEAPTAGSDVNVTASNLTNSTAANATSGKKPKEAPKGNVRKVNLTAEVTILDMPMPSPAATTVAMDKLVRLYEIDQDKVANEKAKNSLESHVFETKDAMYSEAVTAVSTEEQRDVIMAALNEAADWLEDEGYIAETKVYKDKLRELKRVSREVFKRVSEATKRPKLLASLATSLNISHDFLSRMKNLSSEVQIFTEVEITALETIIEETEQWISKKLVDQENTPPHEEPALLSYDIEEHSKKLDREVMYLLNKLRSHPPPKLKVPTNKTNGTTDNQTKSDNTTKQDEPSLEDILGETTPNEAESKSTDETTPTSSESEPVTPEPLELEGIEPLSSEGLQQEDKEKPRQEL